MYRMKHTLILVAAALVLAACSQDEPTGDSLPVGEYPLLINAAGLQAIATPQTRGTYDGNWDEVETVAVKVDGQVVKSYKVKAEIGSGSAYLSPAEPLGIGAEDLSFWWTSTTQTKNITAWCPYSETEPIWGGSWSVKPNQSEGIPAEADILYATRTITFGNEVFLQFGHLMAKVVINILASDYLEDYSKEDISVTMNNMECSGNFKNDGYGGLSLIGNGTSSETIIPHPCDVTESNHFASYEALIIPQDLIYKGKYIEVKVGSTVYRWDLSIPDIRFYSGSHYTCDITIKAAGLDVQVAQSTTWTDGNDGEGSVALP